jgi:phosphotransferase system enzyme I (PtsP)
MAGDPAAALLLMAMGVDNLSMSLGNLLKIKWLIRSIDFGYAQELLQEVLNMPSASVVRERLNEILDRHGLGGLIRIGK